MKMRPVALCLGVLVVSTIFAQTGSINGFVRDASDGEPLAYCNVYLDKTEFGAATNDNGYFYIGHVPQGKYELVASFVGYKNERRTLWVGPNQTVNVNLELSPGAIEVKEVKVTADRARFEREVEVSAVRLETKQLQFIPKVGGEVDLFRTIQLLPGVIATSDFSNRLYIRGGSPDQNLILLDGITVYNPSHLFGLFSPFIAEAVSDVTLLAGGFPAKYGGRLSSVLDVTTKEGNSKRYTGDASASVIAAQALVEGPLGRTKGEGESGNGEVGVTNPDSALDARHSTLVTSSKGSFLLAGRRTYLADPLLKAFGAKGLGYYFYDGIGRVNYALNPDSRFSLSGLVTGDVLRFWDPFGSKDLDGRLTWGCGGASAQWNRVFTPILYGTVTAAYSRFKTGLHLDLGSKLDGDMLTGLDEVNAKSDFTWYASDNQTVGFGAEAGFVREGTTVDFDTIQYHPRADVIFVAGYAGNQWDIVPDKVSVKQELRYSFYSNGSHVELEPRVGVKYRVGRNTAISAALGRFTQPMVTLNSTEAVFSVFDIWQPVPADRPLPSALHYVAGVEHWLRTDAVLKLEGYYKDYSDLLETRHGSMFTPPESLLSADGYSCGADLLLKKTEGWVTGWVGYSFMWMRRSIGDEAFFPHYDRRHSVNVVLEFPAAFWGVDASAHWSLGTGLPYAGIVGYSRRYQYEPTRQRSEWRWEVIEGPRDAFRYPTYHRLDAGLSRAWSFGAQGRPGLRCLVTAYLDVINVYNAKNVFMYYWESSSSEWPPPQRKQIGMIPLLPSVGVRVRF
jgi:hypothetical protein